MDNLEITQVMHDKLLQRLSALECSIAEGAGLIDGYAPDDIPVAAAAAVETAFDCSKLSWRDARDFDVSSELLANCSYVLSYLKKKAASDEPRDCSWPDERLANFKAQLEEDILKAKTAIVEVEDLMKLLESNPG